MNIQKISKYILTFLLPIPLLFSPALGVSAQTDTRNLAEVLSENTSTSTLWQAVEGIQLDNGLRGIGPLTVFAPSNQAFSDLGESLDVLLQPENEDLLADIINYHIVSRNLPGDQADSVASTVTVQGDSLEFTTENNQLLINGSARVTTPDIIASNGRIHIIDEVLLSADLQNRVEDAAGEAESVSEQNIPETAAANSSTSTLSEALEKTDLTTDLSGSGPYTVFAPNNQAFDELGDKWEVLQKDENKQLLTDILKYHVISGDVSLTQAQGLDSASTLQGGTLLFTSQSSSLSINNSAQVVAADIGTTNGRIHLIDKVLLSNDLSQRLDSAVNTANNNANTDDNDLFRNPLFWLALAVLAIALIYALSRSLRKDNDNGAGPTPTNRPDVNNRM